MKYETVLFDWDGCLFNNLTTWLVIYSQVLERYGITTTDKIIAKKLFGNWNGPLEIGVKAERLDQLNKELLALAADLLPQSELHSNARKLLISLKSSGVQLGLVSTSKYETVGPLLEKNNILNLFSTIVTGDKVTKHKPDPESINLAMANLGAKKETTLMVGDSEKDTLSAANANIDSVLFLPELHRVIYDFDFLKSTGPTYVVKNLIDILEI